MVWIGVGRKIANPACSVILSEAKNQSPGILLRRLILRCAQNDTSHLARHPTVGLLALLRFLANLRYLLTFVFFVIKKKINLPDVRRWRPLPRRAPDGEGQGIGWRTSYG